ncbi:uncharacterized protein A1O5_08825 [Cladophialophora psammophila CBS 110553]|uniref:C2H2-type domain-containing protein n=1 Tax=Cladophialophora psammophila CBS 110553 TaxID=1182543 RepID=W9WT51_9EURO|nr:uncharacterized protein A1O5_08825 [Cladophialophora psammophila CBS 110553]EXJ68210.1 hypothetical protein A1O5_08825 [Cladophialophora psammophila CBS 110553]
MDVQTQSRGARIFSILNDNDCPSFVIRPRQSRHSSPEPEPESERRRSSISPSYSPPQREERPLLLRQPKYARESSISSVGSPPLLRLSSSSSKGSSFSMDSSPSPATPYNYVDNSLLHYDPLVRQDLVGYLPSPTTVTPFLEQHLMITPNMPDQFSSKLMHHPLTPAQYPIVPAPLHPGLQTLHPTSTNATTATAPVLPPVTSAPACEPAARTSPTTSTAPPSGKKNKYPCPYAQSHNCQATFTTSGHAARHGKKHTGEKGVHCPICNKAFTRKDNMKQHVRTHKGLSASGSTSDESTRKSKAAITKDAQKAKQRKKLDKINTEASRRSSLIHSPLSEVTSIAPTAIDTPLNVEDSAFYQEPPQIVMPIQAMPESVSPSSLYPPLVDDPLLNSTPIGQVHTLRKSTHPTLGGSGLLGSMPPLTRGFSDLDTLAQAAESFDTSYYHPTL